MILFIVASNPKSKHRSASSSTKIWWEGKKYICLNENRVNELSVLLHINSSFPLMAIYEGRKLQEANKQHTSHKI
jgi:hypothetical protein